MMRTRFAFIWFFAVFLMLPGIAVAQSKAGEDWSILRVLRTGEKLDVKLRNGKSVHGEFGSATDGVLTVVKAHKMTDVRRDEIAKIYLVSAKHIGHSVAIGAGVGAGFGAALGAALPVLDDRLGSAVSGAVIFAIPGAIGGLVIGAVHSNHELIYEAKTK
jgi:hypothetical protein